jgi:hypothetical protein
LATDNNAGLQKEFEIWLSDASLRDKFLIKRSREALKSLEAEGLWGISDYKNHMLRIYECYVALGDLEKAKKSLVFLVALLNTMGNKGAGKYMDILKNPNSIKSNKLWGRRAKTEARPAASKGQGTLEMLPVD